jgi:hypothetical protein
MAACSPQTLQTGIWCMVCKVEPNKYNSTNLLKRAAIPSRSDKDLRRKSDFLGKGDQPSNIHPIAINIFFISIKFLREQGEVAVDVGADVILAAGIG